MSSGGTVAAEQAAAAAAAAALTSRSERTCSWRSAGPASAACEFFFQVVVFCVTA